jgi:hypothetical protein
MVDTHLLSEQLHEKNLPSTDSFGVRLFFPKSQICGLAEGAIIDWAFASRGPSMAGLDRNENIQLNSRQGLDQHIQTGVRMPDVPAIVSKSSPSVGKTTRHFWWVLLSGILGATTGYCATSVDIRTYRAGTGYAATHDQGPFVVSLEVRHFGSPIRSEKTYLKPGAAEQMRVDGTQLRGMFALFWAFTGAAIGFGAALWEHSMRDRQ